MIRASRPQFKQLCFLAAMAQTLFGPGPKLQPVSAIGTISRNMAVTDDQLRHARSVVAEIVATHDEKYAPLFEILDNEMKRRDARARAINQTIAKYDFEKLRAARRKRRNRF